MEASLYTLPNYVIADSPDSLRARMLDINMELGAQVKYQDIQQDKNGKWIAWYYEEARIEFNKIPKQAKAK